MADLVSWAVFDKAGFPIAFADAHIVPRWELEAEFPDAAGQIRMVSGDERDFLLRVHAGGRPADAVIHEPKTLLELHADGELFPPEPGDVLPYGGTSGSSGSETSDERAADMDVDGRIKERDKRTWDIVWGTGDIGLTWRELADQTGMHHGEASGSLSRLHLAGHLARLTERRDRCQVYVHPKMVKGRDTSEYRPNVSKRVLLDLCDDLDDCLRRHDVIAARHLIAQTRAKFGQLHS